MSVHRRAGRISYREDSSEDDNEEDSSYDSVDLEEISPQPEQSSRKRSRASPPSRRQSTRNRHGIRESLRDVSTEASTDDDLAVSVEPSHHNLEESEVEQAPKPKKPRTTSQQATTRIQRTRKSASKPRRRAIPTSKTLKEKPRQWITVDTDGICPPWSTLPYDMVFNMFRYAYNAYAEGSKGGSSWLASAARTCKAFAEPALSALYWCPPINHNPQAVLQLLSEPSEKHFIDYNAKVKYLQIDERNALLYTKFDLPSLIPRLPVVNHIDIWSDKDRIRLKQILFERSWQYPLELFDRLEDADLTLKSWSWNERMIPAKLIDASPYAWMGQVHARSPFRRLRRLTLTNICPATDSRLLPASAQASAYGSIADALAVLPHLESLHFEYCDIDLGEWLQSLPNSLTALEFHCCDPLDSNSLQEFLLAHGGLLKRLVLNHNIALNLSFLPSLKMACPRLEVLEMDLSYFNSTDRMAVAKPVYDDLVLPGEEPTWPSTLFKLELLHLRRWNSDVAVVFFNSLINSAHELPHLRHLMLSASIGIEWRDRAGFRDQWVSKFNRVFRRKSKPPSPHLVSLKAFRLWKAKQKAQIRENAAERDGPDATNGILENAGRLRPRRNLRRTSTDGQDLGNDESGPFNGDVETSEERVQGMCDVVEIRIDNSRPAANELHESDFLDSEKSGDDDYDE